MTAIEALTELEHHALADLADAGEWWLEDRAAGKDCGKAAAAIREAEQAFRKIERKKRKLERKARRK